MNCQLNGVCEFGKLLRRCVVWQLYLGWISEILFSKYNLNFNQFTLRVERGGEDLIGESVICRSTGLLSDERSLRLKTSESSCGSFTSAISRTSSL